MQKPRGASSLSQTAPSETRFEEEGTKGLAPSTSENPQSQKFQPVLQQFLFACAPNGTTRCCYGGLLISVSKLMGKRVIAANAYTLGEVHGAEVDTDKWQITHMHVSLTDEATRELRFKKPILCHVVACLPINLIQAIGDVIPLNKSLQELRQFVEPKKTRLA